MTWYNLPNMIGSTGRGVQRLIRDTGTVNLGTGTTTDQETRVPASGDLAALTFVITAQLTGAPSAATTIDNAINTVLFKDAGSTPIFTNMTGISLYTVFGRYLDYGRQKTIPSASTSSQTARVTLPINIERDYLPGLLTIVFNPFATLSGGGSTAGTARVQVFGIYAESGTVSSKTYRYDVINVGGLSAAGNYNRPEVLPTDYDIEHIFMQVTTETNVNDITLSRDGGEEIVSVTMDHMIALEEDRLFSGHLTGYVDLNVMPFRANSRTVLRFNMAAADTGLKLFVVKYTDSARRRQ